MTTRLTSPTKPQLSVAKRTGKGAPRVGYAVASLVGIFAILGAQLGLSIVLSDGAYRILSLERELVDRSRDLDIVAEDIGHMLDPQAVASLAVAMGMVQSRDSSYLRLSDRAVIGGSTPAGANVVAVVDVVPGEAEIVEETGMLLANSDRPEADQATDFDIVDVTIERPSQDTLEGVAAEPLPVLVTSVQEPTKKFGGDLPAPTTR
jgi:hypothetical protein